ncbi:MAG: uracil-DNA glycosylase [Desulfofustis sp.]|nr:uracil-DNA glycosylase [Desulfofustis sp.]
MTTAELLKSIRSLVAYHQSCGIEHYRRSAALDRGLQQLEDVADKALSEDTKAATKLKRRLVEEPGNAPGAVSIAELAEEITTCHLCTLCQSRNVSTPGEGGLSPDLLVVGDWLVSSPEGSSESIFGEQQDQMLYRMIAAMELQPSMVFVTNLIKCSVPETLKPDPSQIASCLGYLKQQIALLAPRAILTMGSAASQTLLGSSRPLIGLRGKFHQFRVGGGPILPLMPTFHPSYLLKNPEMKQPTWNDLQAVQKKLALPVKKRA